jgi:large subunit ribosomal protein L9
MTSKKRKVLLNETVRHVGKVGDVVEVSPGYARNYLIPKGLAVEPTPGNLKRVEARRAEVERLERERRATQEAMIGKLQSVEITLVRRANEQGHLFGSVSATDIANELKAMGYDLEPGDINLKGRLDRIDRFSVEVRFSDDLATEIKVYVAPDEESKAAMEAAAKAKAEAPASPGE